MAKGRSYNQRLKLFYLLDYLLEKTNEDHTVKTLEIVKHLNGLGIPVERKTVVTDIHLLEEYGVDVEYDAKTQGYRIFERDFQLHELQLLIDSVQASKFITQKVAKELTDKLKKQASSHDRPVLERRSYVINRVRSMNNSVFYYVDDLHIAIANDWQIKFRYFSYTLQKEKRYLKKGELYTASPYALLWDDGNYYLLAYHDGQLKHFRVDRMDSIEIAMEKREGKEEFKKINLSDRSLKVFSMYSGREQRVTLRFSNHLVNVVFDRFGRDVMLIPDGDKHFTMTVEIEISPQFFGWLCGLGKGVRIVSPASAAAEMGEYVKAIAEMY